MSLTKKDPSFCVAANDPHLVSLGGGRLSTAVTIHNIPIGTYTYLVFVFCFFFLFFIYNLSLQITFLWENIKLQQIVL